jgi:hypothetical protein
LLACGSCGCATPKGRSASSKERKFAGVSAALLLDGDVFSFCGADRIEAATVTTADEKEQSWRRSIPPVAFVNFLTACQDVEDCGKMRVFLFRQERKLVFTFLLA